MFEQSSAFPIGLKIKSFQFIRKSYSRIGSFSSSLGKNKDAFGANYSLAFID